MQASKHAHIACMHHAGKLQELEVKTEKTPSLQRAICTLRDIHFSNAWHISPLQKGTALKHTAQTKKSITYLRSVVCCEVFLPYLSCGAASLLQDIDGRMCTLHRYRNLWCGKTHMACRCQCNGLEIQ